ncbi:MAG: PSD1 domain-containing protein, partial [Planctomycetes bacterium]|nr:PSD1 domain-containing protein [Planctomycetota bacterium]
MNRQYSLGADLLLAVVAGLFTQALAVAEDKNSPGAKLPAPANVQVDFARDIQPVFVKYCFQCHGPEKQLAGLRLDRQGDAVRGGDSGPAFEAGKSAESLLIRYIGGLDPDIIMPPEGYKFSTAEVALFRAWIDQGAKWPADATGDNRSAATHWAFQPIRRPAEPQVKAEAWIRNPVDRFILAKLESLGVSPSPEADRRVLIRRLSLDLLGLPPTPQEISDFLGDPRQDAYERLVDRMLQSPHFGERWGRHWLDLARYADSDGYEKDSPRPFAWRYRNWVIDAFNRDLPFDQFTIEQLAGDLLPNAAVEQKVATGFHRNTLTNKEGGVDQEEFRVAAVVDRVNTTGTVWLGLTVGCAQCHSHKYDPILLKEYYGLFAFFNQGQETDLPAPLPAEAAAYAQAKKEFDAGHAPYLQAIADFEKTQLPDRMAAWEASLDKSSLPSWTTLEPISAASASGAKLLKQVDGSYLVSGDNKAVDTYSLKFKGGLSGVTAFRIEVLPDPSLPANGPGRVAHGNFVLSEFQVSVAGPGAAEPQPVAFRGATADFSQDQYAAGAAIDGDLKTGWAIAPKFGTRHVAVFETQADLEIPANATISIVLDQQHGGQHTLGRFRISVAMMPRPVPVEGFPADVVQALLKSPDRRNNAEHKKVVAYYAPLDSELIRLRQAEMDHARQAPPPPATRAPILTDQVPYRKTHIHVRGDFLRKGEEVQPHTPALLPPLRMTPGRVPNRLDLARWLVDPANPLTPRVAMNRIWKHLFGQPLVTSAEDFGTRGEKPSHPELLDWIAAEFMVPTSPPPPAATPWSVKRMIKLIVLSSTYRQVSHIREDMQERDPRNVWLARQGRFRVEAEVLRDICLATSGLLTPTVGGPSVRPKQPAGVSELTYAGSARWVESAGPDRYRRGLYTW